MLGFLLSCAVGNDGQFRHGLGFVQFANLAVAKIAEGELLNLSFYQIDDYLTCPLKYKYVHILRVPIMEHHTVIYGRAMHEAVTKYFQFKWQVRKWSLPIY